MRVRQLSRLPRFHVRNEREIREKLTDYLVELVKAVEQELVPMQQAINVNEHGAFIVGLSDTMPGASESVLGMLFHERRTGGLADRLWWCRYNAAGALELFELSAAGGGGGDNVQVNGVAVIDANFNDTTPAAVGTGRNVFFQRSGSGPDSVSAYMNLFTALLAGIVPASGGGTANYLRADGTWAAPTAAVAATTIEVDLGAVAKWSGRFTITDAGISATSKVLCWQAPGPYTGKGTRADEAEMQPVNVIAVTPAAGSAVVHWQTPPAFVAEPVVPNGRRDAPSTAVGFDPRYPYQDVITRRKGLVRGNVKFSYLIMS